MTRDPCPRFSTKTELFLNAVGVLAATASGAAQVRAIFVHQPT